jgi:aryl-alcohol dehydrogenase-like predicted oxidoreductase
VLRPLASDLDVFPLCLGGNVFGWTADEAASHAVLDAYAEAGGNFVDVADSYPQWAAHAGLSEEILGRWLARRSDRDRFAIATKVGQTRGLSGLSAATVARACEGSLQRLGIERIDLYYAHEDDPATPLAETLRAFDALVRAGKVRHVAASNYTAPRLAEALATSRAHGLASYVALQPHYNLVHRDGFEGDLAALCLREGLACVPYYALASGFLTGKYRPGAQPDTARGGGDAELDARGIAVLEALDRVAGAHGTSVASVALAWLAAQPAVVAPIASARTPEQLAELLPMADLVLDAAELAALDDASRATAGRP